MCKNFFIVISALLLIFTNVSGRIPDKNIREKIEKVKLNHEQIKKVTELHHIWYLQAINSLLGAFGREMYLKMDRSHRKAFVNCLDDIDEELDIREGAKCIVAAWDGKLLIERRISESIIPNYNNYSMGLPNNTILIQSSQVNFPQETIETMPKKKSHRFDILSQKLSRNKSNRYLKLQKKKIFVRSKPAKLKGHIKSIVVRNRPLQQKLPFRLQLLKAKAEKLLAKKQIMLQQQRFKRSPYRLNHDGDEKDIENRNNRRQIKTLPQMESLFSTKPKTPIQTLTSALTNMVRAIDPPRNGKVLPWKNSYKKLLDLNSSLKSQYQQKRYRRRMLDIVMNQKASYENKKRRVSDEMRYLMPEKGMPKLFKSALALADTIHQHTNSTKFTFLSPKFGSIVAQEKDSANRFLSPNLFPFYKDDTAILPIPEMLEATGMSKEDETAVMDLVMEASGTNNMVQDIIQILNETEISSFASDINGVSDVIMNAFKKLSEGLHRRQKRQLKERHYTFIKADQLRELVGKDGIYNISNYPIDIDDYETWSEVKKKKIVMNAIRMIASAPEDFDVGNMVNFHLNPELREKHRRHKRQGIELELEADVLSPFAFAPLHQEPQILGPIILSPGIFSPPLLSPAVLSPCILSPQFMSPLIMSPYLLSPNILSPSAFLPYILSPYCLSPNILQPYLFTPLILSPHALCPDIMSPTLLSGIILNPFVFSPAVKTQSFLAIEVLSPSAFSKK